MIRVYDSHSHFQFSFACIAASVIFASGCGDSTAKGPQSEDGGASNTSGAESTAGNGSGDVGATAQGGSDSGDESDHESDAVAQAGEPSAGLPQTDGDLDNAETSGAAGRASAGGAGDGGESNAGAPPTEAVDSGLVGSLAEVQDAVVRIVATGAFRDPEDFVTYKVSGQGSGFIIDPSGIAVTNNHVVAGNARLSVYLNGESEPRNATVLGVSECSDLAIIDIEGDDYRYLQWYEGDIAPGLEVYTFGYPLGVTDFAMTRGIVSQPAADGETQWSSVDYVISHDATISPGNSGGPLVNTAGDVIGVNFAGISEYSQYFAVGREEVYRVLPELMAGHNVTTIGINGTVVQFTDGTYGIWVAAVSSGSPADNVRLRPGDVIVLLENVPVSDEGTFEQYCDTLRSRGSNDVLSITVLRPDTDEVLEGRINGSPLECIQSAGADSETDEPGQADGSSEDDSANECADHLDMSDECMSCIGQSCCSEYMNCGEDQDCVDLLSCLVDCTTESCWSDCESEYGDGVAPLNDFLDCRDDECTTSCSASG